MPPQYKVPQNVDVEDKLLGPFTFKQFIYLLIGGVTSYLLFLMLGEVGLPFVLVLFVAALPFLVALAFAVLKIDDQPLEKVLKSTFWFLSRPSKRVFRRQPNLQDIEVKEGPKDAEKKVVKKHVTGEKIGALADVLDTQGWAGSAPQKAVGGELFKAPQSFRSGASSALPPRERNPSEAPMFSGAKGDKPTQANKKSDQTNTNVNENTAQKNTIKTVEIGSTPPPPPEPTPPPVSQTIQTLESKIAVQEELQKPQEPAISVGEAKKIIAKHAQSQAPKKEPPETTTAPESPQKAPEIITLEGHIEDIGREGPDKNQNNNRNDLNLLPKKQ